MALDLTLVEAYLAVLDGGGFHAAAARLGRAQPTVSQQVRKLERSLGVPLVRRSRLGCAATTEGARFAPLARRALEVARRAAAAVAGGRLVVGAASNPAIYLLPRMLDPGAELRIGTNPEALARLEAGEVDLAVTEWWDGRPGYDAVAWHEEPMVGIVAPSHRWAELGRVPLDAFLAEPLVGGEPGTGTGRLLSAALGPGTPPPRVVRQMGSTEGVKRAVAAGLGVSVVLACAVGDEVAAGSLRALRFEGDPLCRHFFAVIGSDVPDTAPGRRFLARLLSGTPGGAE
jgi:DNA-binding transcriptional LysR family regulator